MTVGVAARPFAMAVPASPTCTEYRDRRLSR